MTEPKTRYTALIWTVIAGIVAFLLVVAILILLWFDPSERKYMDSLDVTLALLPFLVLGVLVIFAASHKAVFHALSILMALTAICVVITVIVDSYAMARTYLPFTLLALLIPQVIPQVFYYWRFFRSKFTPDTASTSP